MSTKRVIPVINGFKSEFLTFLTQYPSHLPVPILTVPPSALATEWPRSSRPALPAPAFPPSAGSPTNQVRSTGWILLGTSGKNQTEPGNQTRPVVVQESFAVHKLDKNISSMCDSWWYGHPRLSEGNDQTV